MQDDGPWHLDRRVPLALIATIALQTAGLVWWASSLNATVAEHAQKLARVETIETRRTLEERDLAGRLARIEGGLGELTRGMSRIEAAIGRQERAGQ